MTEPELLTAEELDFIGRMRGRIEKMGNAKGLAEPSVSWLHIVDSLSQELKAAREELREYHHIVESDLIRDGWDHPINRCSCGEFECETAADLVSLSNRQSDMEERANRYQMQYEMECEAHGETRAEVQRLRGELRSGSRPSPG